ncbi:hypothetical protein KR084_006482, partial [Drosophila pseudotakahashii]
VSSEDNPADLVSRGCSAQQLRHRSFWFCGPSFLTTEQETWKQAAKPIFDGKDLERRNINTQVMAATANSDWTNEINHHGSFNTLITITGWLLRFVNNCKKGKQKETGPITTKEREQALQRIMQKIQGVGFQATINQLRNGGCVAISNPYRSLDPFLDKNNLLRVGGRLQNSNLTFDEKHPMMLPANHEVTRLMFEDKHRQFKHCGPQALLAITRQRFRTINGKQLASTTVRRCVICCRARPRLLRQIMSPLPGDRVRASRPFRISGVDYCGPFWVHYKIRGKKPHNMYLAIFCCFSTKAVHLEVVSDLTTQAFLAALKRFNGRRGIAEKIYCDNATNFVGARNELYEIKASIYSTEAQKAIKTRKNAIERNFQFIPPRAPHFGGLWEAAVKSAKHLLIRTVSTADLTYVELETVVIDIEAILNSRPLTPISSSPRDLAALTPGHFLIGGPITASPDIHNREVRSGQVTRWKQIDKVRQDFWKRWSHEYLHELQNRSKWTRKEKAVSIGDLVVIKEDNVSPLQWPLGRVITAHQGKDGAVRVASLRTAAGECVRAIHRLAILPVDKQENAVASDGLRSLRGCVS